MDDMDISESEHSDKDASDDDDDWEPRRRKTSRNRTSHFGTHPSDSNDLNSGTGEITRKVDGPCCTCSRWSSCKTPKCQCRANGNGCGQSCGCSSVKCSNRDAEANMANDVGANDENNPVAKGAMLLQNALEGEKVVETNDDGAATKRKALTDIGNTLVRLLDFFGL